MKIYSNDIHCENCSKRIIQAFAKENINVEVNISEKFVTVPDDKASFAIELLDDLGFSVSQ